MSELEIVQGDQYEEDAIEDQGGDEKESVVRLAIEDAVDFIDNTMSPPQGRGRHYYEALHWVMSKKASQAQTMDVRDTVQSMLPSLLEFLWIRKSR